MKPNIVWYDIPALDLDRAIQFYSAVLGAPVVKETIDGVALGWLPTEDGERMGCVCCVPGFKPSADGVMIYLSVNKRLKAAVTAVRENGGTVQSDIHSIGAYGFRAEVLDSEGNCIALHAETDGLTNPDIEIRNAISKYLHGRHEILELGRKHPSLLGGNDNVIGRIGEFIALRFLEGLGQKPSKMTNSSNPGYDFIDNQVKTQVKVITEENQKGRNVRIRGEWTQLVIIDLGENYRPKRVGLLTKDQFNLACAKNLKWSAIPFAKRSMLGKKGLIGKYGVVYDDYYLNV